MADTKISGLAAVTVPAVTDEIPVNQAGASKKLTVAQIAELFFTRISGNSGAAGAFKTLQRLTANATANATVTLQTVMTTTGLAAGVYHFRYDVIYQAGATTTGVDFAIGFSGTAPTYVATSRFASTGGAAATGIADDVGSNTASMLEGKSQRTLSGKLGSSLGVSTINANHHYKIEGILEVTVSGNLTLQHCSEVAASSQVMAKSILELTKVS